jgi:CRP-like cAMP-binding protein
MRSEARRLGPVERLLHIKAMPAAQGLSDESLMALATHALEHEFRAGERLHAGEHAPSFCYILTSGRVRVTLNGVTLYEVGSLGVVGALEVCASVVGTLEATALEGGLALKISRETLLGIYEDHFSVMHAAVRGIAEMLLAAPWDQITAEAITPIAESSSMHGNVLGRLADLVTAFPKARADSLLRLALAMENVDVPDGTVLWEIGEPAHHMLFVLRGAVGCELAPLPEVLEEQITIGSETKAHASALARPIPASFLDASAAQARKTTAGNGTSAGSQATAVKPKAPAVVLEDSGFRASAGMRVGLFESLAERPRWHRAVAVGQLAALRLPVERLLTRMEDDFEFASAILAGLANNLLTVLRKKGG